MAINFTDSPSNGATQTISGRTYTYNSAKNKWDTTATEVTGPTATVYASVDNLPTSGNITGSQAFVSGTNRLYIWNGSGWYNIALINNTPTISGVSAAYDLANDGTATTVTIVATDPEGLPITYSIASDTSGNIATVAQGTGSNTNVFTITPSTNSAHAGTFSLTFRASDGVNLATAVSSFTLQFSVANQRYTTALITSVGANNATNASFDDKSTNDHTITATGNARQNSFSPYRHGGYSTHFDGNGDKIEFPQTTVIGTNDFTIEAWVYPEGFGATECIFCTLPSGSSTSIQLNVDTGGALELWYKGVQTTDRVNISNVFTLNTWHHIAVVGDGTANEIKIYKDGTQIGSTISYDYNYSASGVMRVGTNRGDVTYFDGYLRDVRLVHSKVYTANFTAPTEPLTAITNTKLLTCHLPYIVDGSSDANAATISGNVSTEPFGPYDAQEYAVGDHGGSVYLDGTGDRLTVGSTTDLGFGTGDFTIEYWIKHESKLSGSNYPYAFDMRSQDNDAKIALYHRTNVNNIVGIYVSQNTIVSGTNQMYDGMDWVHYAVCKTGGYLKGYFNGKQDFSVADSTDYGSSGQISIGGTYSNLYHMQGHIADFRVVKGTAVYTAEFTPPTAPLTAITNTSLLVQSTDAAIIDKSQSISNLTLQYGSKSSTAQTKYLSSSIDFTADLAEIYVQQDEAFFAGDFTIEAWIWSADIDHGGTDNVSLFDWRPTNTNGNYVLLWVYAASSTAAYWVNGSYRITANTTLSDSTWHHVAVSREGSTHRMFIDGTLQTQTWTDSGTYLMPVNRPIIGNSGYHRTASQHDFDGYMSDIRFTKGLARYTANFTPPAAALQG